MSKKLINKLIREQCDIFGFDSSNVQIKQIVVSELTFITVHFDISTSTIHHRYILLCLSSLGEIKHQTSNAIDKSYFYSLRDCIIMTKNYFNSMAHKLNKLTIPAEE